jgi:hypothetical protein
VSFMEYDPDDFDPKTCRLEAIVPGIAAARLAQPDYPQPISRKC